MPGELIKKESPWEKFRIPAAGTLIFFYLSMAVFLATSAGYGGLFLVNKNLVGKGSALVEAVQTKGAELRKDLHDILFLESRLKNLEVVLTKHAVPSRVIQFLEERTHPLVQFSGFSFSVNDRMIQLGGTAASYTIAAEQFSIFEQDPEVETIEFGGFSLGEARKVSFRLKISVKPSLLQFQP